MDNDNRKLLDLGRRSFAKLSGEDQVSPNERKWLL